MQNHHASEGRRQESNAPTYPRLELVTAPTVPTEQAAYYLGRKGQTLREWACFEKGPLRPLRVHGRLAWPVARIKELMGVA